MGWPWLSLRPMLGDTTAAHTDTAMDVGTDTDMARGPLMLTPAPTLGVTDMAAHTAMAATDMGTDSPTPVTDTDTIMARGQLMPMPGDTDTAAHTMVDTDTGTDTVRGLLMPSLRPGDTMAAHTDTVTDTGTDTLMASKLPPTWSPATAPPQ